MYTCEAFVLIFQLWNFVIQLWKSHGKVPYYHDVCKAFVLIFQSWNFVIRSWKSHGKVMEFCPGNFMATLSKPINTEQFNSMLFNGDQGVPDLPMISIDKN